MPTIKFLLQSTKENAPVYCRFSLGRGKDIKRRTGLTCNANVWDKKNGRAKGKEASQKALNSHLSQLDRALFDKYNLAQANGVTIDGKWLAAQIESFFDRTPSASEQPKPITIVEYADKFVNGVDHRVTDQGKKGVTKATKKKYLTILNKLKSYDEYSGFSHLLEDVNPKYIEDLDAYLVKVDGLSGNTAGRYLKAVKTIVLNARKNGLIVDSRIDMIRGYTIDPPIVTLSFDEIDKIRSTQFDQPSLRDTRDWLVIGCYTGQRVSDLLRMKRSMIEEAEGFQFIVLTQKKTNKLVQIPIHNIVQETLNMRDGNFPQSFGANLESASAIFNKNLKIVCRQAGINETTTGTLFDKKVGRGKLGNYEKWKIISSHVCRRSFATNFYSKREYPTPLLMNITAHSTEKMFLKYIGKQPLDYSLQLARIWKNENDNKL
ncbi:MAG: phage integrase SAM-like domain-containing protein [Salibacteraceae bacterium]